MGNSSNMICKSCDNVEDDCYLSKNSVCPNYKSKENDDNCVLGGINQMLKEQDSNVSHPNHYGGANNPYEARKVIKAWGLNFNTGNVAKYLSRAGKKDLKGNILKSNIEDLEKAKQYLEFEIEELNEKLEAEAYQDQEKI